MIEKKKVKRKVSLAQVGLPSKRIADANLLSSVLLRYAPWTIITASSFLVEISSA